MGGRYIMGAGLDAKGPECKRLRCKGIGGSAAEERFGPSGEFFKVGEEFFRVGLSE